MTHSRPSHDGDDLLQELNISELLQVAKEQGLGLLNRVSPRQRLIHIVAGEVEPDPEDLCPSIPHRRALQAFIEEHYETLQGQVPICKGRCMDFGCPLGIALDHHDENRHYVDD